MNKEQEKAHVAALERERLGYEARLAKVELDPEEKLSAEQLQGRIDQVDEQIGIYGGNKPKKAAAKSAPKAPARNKKDDSAAK